MQFDAAIPGNPRDDDAEADRRTFLWTAGFMAAALLVVILSAGTELEKQGSSFPLGKIVIYEATGFGAFLAMFPVLTRLVTLATPGAKPWPYVIAFHAAASVAVIAVQVALFVVLRKLLSPLFYGEPYIFTDNLLRDAIYEYRKSALAYVGVVVVIAFARQMLQQRRELLAAREDAMATQRLTLKCGGRAIMIDAASVVWAKSASNYVEVVAAGKTHLARATLTAIEAQLRDAGVKAIRVHRSHVVNADAIREVKPTGEGDVRIEMSDGAVIPGSRRYRDRLNAIVS